MIRSFDERLEDILQAISAIDVATDFLVSESSDDRAGDIAIDAICYRLITIGEAVKAVDADSLESFPGVKWSQIARLRDLITHHYHRRDIDVILMTIGRPLAELKQAVTEARNSLNP